MKRSLMILFLLLSGFTFSQQSTLINSDLSSTGWFGAPVLKFTSLNEKSSLLLGGRAGYIINNSLTIGGGMYSLVTDVRSSLVTNESSTDFDDNLHLMYGGFELGYVFNSMELIHYSFNTLFGVGRASYNNLSEYNEGSSDHHAGDSFFVIEPKAAVELNLTTYLRLEVGISYRLSTGLEYNYISNNDISGLSGNISFNIGSF